jgi:hypothetical protein
MVATSTKYAGLVVPFTPRAAPASKHSIPIVTLCTWLDRDWLSLTGQIEANPGPVLSAVDQTHDLSGLKILHVNGQGIRSGEKVVRIKALLNDFKSPSILAITESGLRAEDSQTSIFNIPGYVLHRFNTPKPFSRSIAVYVPNELTFIGASSKHDAWSNRVWMQIKYRKIVISLGFIYRRPQTSVAFFDCLAMDLAEQIKSSSTFILLGDFNVNIFRDSIDPLRKKLDEAISGLELTQVIEQPTRIARYTDRQTGLIRWTRTLLDHVYVNAKARQLKISPININAEIADHNLVGVVISSKLEVNVPHEHKFEMRHDLNKINSDELSWRLSEERWQNVFGCSNSNEMADQFHKTLNENINACAPLRKFFTCGCRQMKFGRDPWYTKELKKLRQEKDAFYKEFSCEPDNEILEWIYKTARNNYTRKLFEAEKAYFAKRYQRAAGDIKKTWKVSNEVMGKTGKKTDKISSLIVGSKVVKEPLQIASAFNNFFIKIGLSSSSKAGTSNNRNETHNPRFNFKYPTLNETLRALLSIDSNKPCGPDMVPPRVYKEHAESLAPIITWMFTNVILTGNFPARWGKSFVTPVYKNKGTTHDMTNYRPITIISAISKVFEKILTQQLVTHLEKHSVLSDNQYGFRKHRSTQFAVLHVTELVRQTLNKSKPCKPHVSALMLDLSKAFDCVNHKLLLLKLADIGIQEDSVQLIHSYLSNRFQTVKLYSTSSDFVYSQPLQLQCGVPQGTVLGPVLFNIYVNSLYDVFCEPNSTLISYADDTTIITEADNIASLVQKTFANLTKIKAHLGSIGLQINLKKTQYMLFGKYPCGEDTFLRISDDGTHVIKPSNTVKLLGVTFSRDLKFEEHQKHVLSKLRSGLFVIKSVRKKITMAVAKQLVNSLIYSHHDYCALVWNEHGSTATKQSLENTHKMVWRVVYFKPNDYPSNNVYPLASTVPLEYRRKHIMLRFAHSALHGLVPHNWRNFLEFSSEERSQVSRRTCIHRTQATIFHMGLQLQACRLWNNLPRDIRDCRSSVKFKRLSGRYVHKAYNSKWTPTGLLAFPSTLL